MFIERPPLLLRLLLPGVTFRVPQARGERNVYLTFDDGPIPEATPEVLQMLREQGVKATFFMVADNARRYPELVKQVMAEGHAIGSHTMHHLQGLHTSTAQYLTDAQEALKYLPEESARLFRPPHGLMRPSQRRALLSQGRVVLYDVLTRDYARRVTASDITRTVERLVRPGSIIVFHDSLRSIAKLRECLPPLLAHLLARRFTPRPL